jgi:hypothetical protein
VKRNVALAKKCEKIMYKFYQEMPLTRPNRVMRRNETTLAMQQIFGIYAFTLWLAGHTGTEVEGLWWRVSGRGKRRVCTRDGYSGVLLLARCC